MCKGTATHRQGGWKEKTKKENKSEWRVNAGPVSAAYISITLCAPRVGRDFVAVASACAYGEKFANVARVLHGPTKLVRVLEWFESFEYLLEPHACLPRANLVACNIALLRYCPACQKAGRYDGFTITARQKAWLQPAVTTIRVPARRFG